MQWIFMQKKNMIFTKLVVKNLCTAEIKKIPSRIPPYSNIRRRTFRSSYYGGKKGWLSWLFPPKNKDTIFDDSHFKRIIVDSTKEEQERGKIIFAEGYLAGRLSDPPRPRFFRSLLAGVIVGFFLPLVVFFLLLINLSRIDDEKPVSFIDPEKITTTFHEVKGVAEAKEELQDLVEFLKHPKKFTALGAKLPKGILLVGPPGTGKTMLARAVAGEAAVPFFHMSGSEFEQTFVGEGARRVRELFKVAKRNAPCVIFIDEIDSVGSKRISSPMHPHSNQTINQLLTEMDGFQPNQGVIVLGATNRRDDLDNALLRPGRFDVQIYVPPPNYEGRKEILKHYLDHIASEEMDLDFFARGTVGFTGADLENMVNQAALRAAIEGLSLATRRHLEKERDRILMGPEKKSLIPDRQANRITAFHEGGHAVVAFFTKDAYPLHKVTIVPRGDSLGHTSFIPEKEEVYVTKAQQLARIDTLMGGRAAEELIFGADSITSGAACDLEVATTLVSRMVKIWGMSEKVGLRSCKSGELSPGQGVRDDIDAEINRILTESYDRAKSILQKHGKEHALLAEALIKHETLDADDVKAIMVGRRMK